MILIVDDKAENIFSLKRTLERNGFEVDTAESGEEALKKILKNAYALIILDVQMPGMDGFEVAEAISGYSKARDTPIIFLSAVNTDKKFITKGYTSGGVDYIAKPVDPEIFMLKVKTLHKLYEQNRALNDVQHSLMAEIEFRKRAEDELNKKVQELHFILEAIPQIAFTLTSDGKIEYVNEQWYLYAPHAKTMPQFHADDMHIAERWEESIRTGTALVCEVRIHNIISNTYRYHLLKMLPVKKEDQILKWVGTFTDIQHQKTANKQLETKVEERTQELLWKNKELEASNTELQQFASVASHDLKEPLRKIQISGSILEEHAQQYTPEIAKNLSRIGRAAARMTMLINDLLDYSRLSIETLFQPINLDEIIREILSDLEWTIRDRNAIVYMDNLPLSIYAIPGQMRQVFQNLISNSLKFIRAGVQPVIHVSAERVKELSAESEVDDNGAYCRITVRDNGIGFDEQYLNKIFVIFQRLNQKDAYEGTGIGLAIVKKIMDKHNGIITARSAEGAGAAFIMVLPMQQQKNH